MASSFTSAAGDCRETPETPTTECKRKETQTKAEIEGSPQRLARGPGITKQGSYSLSPL